MDISEIIPHIPVTINENDVNNGAIEIIKVIRPQWEIANVDFKLLTDGITNKLVGCKPKDEDVAETVLVRVYGNKTDLLIDRKAETRNIILLSKIDLAPKLYATFENGLTYQFVPGCTLSDKTVILPNIYNLVAKRIAKLHKVKVPNMDNPQASLWVKIQKFLDLVPDVFSDTHKNEKYKELIVPKNIITEEIKCLKQVLSKLESPVVFCHNDLLLGNVIYTEEKNCVTFIDYEYASFNYQAYDIGNHFAEFVGLEDIDYRKYPSKQLQLNWLRTYLSEYQGNFNESDVNKLYVQVNKFVLVSHIFWGIWALIQAEHSYIDFDFLQYAAVRFNEYFGRKEELLLLQFSDT